MADENPGTEMTLFPGQVRVLEMIALGEPLQDILNTLVTSLERLWSDAVCSVLLLGGNGRTLRLAAAPNLPEDFKKTLDGVSIGPHGGVCGMAAFRRQCVIISDVATDPLSGNFRDAALTHGFRAWWSMPIFSTRQDILGTLAVYHSSPRAPQPEHKQIFGKAARLARIAIERRLIEDELTTGKEVFRSLIESTSDIIVVLRHDGMIRYLSPSAERVLGFPPEDLIGRSWFDFFHPEDMGPAEKFFDNCLLASGAGLPAELRFRRKNSGWRVLETFANNQLFNTRVAGIIVTGHDITDRKRTEEALISSEERYRELFENANDIIYTCDLSGRLTSVNKAGEQITGYPRKESLAMNIADWVAPEYRALVLQMKEEEIGGAAKTGYELEFVDKSGNRVMLEVSTRLIFQRGMPVAVQGIARNISERKRLEALLLQSQKMEAIGRLAAGVAHDFNNVLTVITGYTQWMLDEFEPESPLRENAIEILLAASRAASLTSQLLAFSRNQVIQPVIVDLNGIVAGLERMLRRVIGEDIELVAKMSPRLGAVKADPGQIEQVILNLVVNARDSMPRGGRLVIETANVAIDSEYCQSDFDCQPGPYVMVSVSDTGFGIDESIRSQIFEPFFTTKDKGKGTGLGLSTVYGIVKQSGGHISFHSESSVGTVFRVFLPRRDEPPSQPRSVGRRRSGRGAETILLVEDEVGVRRMVRDLLSRLGYTILEATDYRSAQNFVLQPETTIHLLLTDVVMPDVSGPELADRLKGLNSSLKVLFMSGYTDDAIAPQGVLEPGIAFLQKPFTPDALAEKVREVLDS